VAPVGNDNHLSGDDNNLKDSPLAGMPKENEPAAEAPAALNWSKGTRVRIEKRTEAYDPFSRDYCTIAAHTKGRIVKVVDPKKVPRGMVPVQIEAPVDNGVGRIVMVVATDLVGTGLFAAH